MNATCYHEYISKLGTPGGTHIPPKGTAAETVGHDFSLAPSPAPRQQGAPDCTKKQVSWRLLASSSESKVYSAGLFSGLKMEQLLLSYSTSNRHPCGTNMTGFLRRNSLFHLSGSFKLNGCQHMGHSLLLWDLAKPQGWRCIKNLRRSQVMTQMITNPADASTT